MDTDEFDLRHPASVNYFFTCESLKTLHILQQMSAAVDLMKTFNANGSSEFIIRIFAYGVHGNTKQPGCANKTRTRAWMRAKALLQLCSDNSGTP